MPTGERAPMKEKSSRCPRGQGGHVATGERVQRRAAGAPEDREAMLQQERECQRERRASGVPEDREAMLQQERECQRERRAAGVPEDREAMLQQERECQRERRAAGAPEDREARVTTGERVLTRKRRAVGPPEDREASMHYSYNWIIHTIAYVLLIYIVKPEFKCISQHHLHAYIIVLLLNMYESFEWMYDARSGSPIDKLKTK